MADVVCSAADPELPSEKVALKTAWHLKSLWEAYVELGPLGTQWNYQRMADCSKTVRLRQVLELDWVESQALASHVSTLIHFKDFLCW